VNGLGIAGVVAEFLTCSAPVEVTAAFVYGSVAADRAGPGSDIDCFVLLAEGTNTVLRERIRSAFTDLQRRLGFTPDPVYPLELFTPTQCRAAFEGDHVRLALLGAAAAEPLDTLVSESDEAEILRALVDTRLSVLDSPEMDDLTRRAWLLVDEVLGERPGGQVLDVLRGLGVHRPRRPHGW
jgi:predicted nucleotidyltransferase